MKQTAAIILAAGKGTRMRSALCKVLHPLAGRAMIRFVTDAVKNSGIDRIHVVIGHQGDKVREALSDSDVNFSVQEEQLGTGHAAACTREALKNYEGNILILCGDVPLIGADTIRDCLEHHRVSESVMTVVTSEPPDSTGYGRIVRGRDNLVQRIVEERDATDEERAIREINTGLYTVDASVLFRLLEKLKPSNVQSEYYLTDIVSEAVKEGLPVGTYKLGSHQEAAGINTRVELAEALTEILDRKRRELMLSGVTLLDPGSAHIDVDVTVGEDTVIHPGVSILGDTTIGRDCVIEPGVLIKDCSIGNRVTVMLGSRMTSATVGDGTNVGPMAHLRPGSVIGTNARIGNFVEVKKSTVGDGSKASHLTYLGDAVIGTGVNIGCGAITCNYDGKAKHPTVIGDDCFIGSDVQFVAPVEIGAGSLIGAGSTITKDVPPRSLAVSRARQKTYPLRKGQGPDTSDENR
jgi:bifunctional UDP-N-acetylglucosamine pyrophosphorylase/glucosamine-1-phosphate N-acetyltransferase